MNILFELIKIAIMFLLLGFFISLVLQCGDREVGCTDTAVNSVRETTQEVKVGVVNTIRCERNQVGCVE